MRVKDVNGYYACDHAPECDYLVDEYMYSDDELADEDELVLCPRCTRLEWLENYSNGREPQW